MIDTDLEKQPRTNILRFQTGRLAGLCKRLSVPLIHEIVYHRPDPPVGGEATIPGSKSNRLTTSWNRPPKACAEVDLKVKTPARFLCIYFADREITAATDLPSPGYCRDMIFQVHGYLLALSAEPSQDCQTNLDRLKKREHTGNVYSKPARPAILFQQYPYHRRPVRHRVEQTLHGLAATVVQFLNDQPATRIAIRHTQRINV